MAVGAEPPLLLPRRFIRALLVVGKTEVPSDRSVWGAIFGADAPSGILIGCPEQALALGAKPPVLLPSCFVSALLIVWKIEIPAFSKMTPVLENTRVVGPGNKIGVHWVAAEEGISAIRLHRDVPKKEVKPPIVFRVCTQVRPEYSPAARFVEEGPTHRINRVLPLRVAQPPTSSELTDSSRAKKIRALLNPPCYWFRDFSRVKKFHSFSNPACYQLRDSIRAKKFHSISPLMWLEVSHLQYPNSTCSHKIN